MNQNAGLGLEESVNVFECPVCCFRVYEVGDGDEGEADNSPDDPELIAKVLNAGQSSLNDSIVADPCLKSALLLNVTCSMYLQLVLIASDAPFVRISNALIL